MARMKDTQAPKRFNKISIGLSSPETILALGLYQDSGQCQCARDAGEESRSSLPNGSLGNPL